MVEIYVVRHLDTQLVSLSETSYATNRSIVATDFKTCITPQQRQPVLIMCSPTIMNKVYAALHKPG